MPRECAHYVVVGVDDATCCSVCYHWWTEP